MRRFNTAITSSLALGSILVAVGCSTPDGNEMDTTTGDTTSSGLSSDSTTASSTSASNTTSTTSAASTTVPTTTGTSNPATSSAETQSTETSSSSSSSTTDTSATTTTSTDTSSDETTSGAGEAWTFEQVMYLFFHEYTEEDHYLGYCTGCHTGGDDGAPKFPRATPQEFHDYLVNSDSEWCFEHKLVVPGDPENSALALILEGKCENDRVMPPTGFTLYPEELAGVVSWITAGANP